MNGGGGFDLTKNSTVVEAFMIDRNQIFFGSCVITIINFHSLKFEIEIDFLLYVETSTYLFT